MKTEYKGETVRGFRVLIDHPQRAKWLSLPCSGQRLYAGEEALEVMRQYEQKRPKLAVLCMTESEFGGVETLTLKEMEEIYGGEQ